MIARVDRAAASRPIRMRLGPDVFAMTEREAISLANQLIDATEQDTP